MLTSEINGLKKGVKTCMLKSSDNNRRVSIKRAHAEELGVDFQKSPPINEVHTHGIIGPGVLYGSVVSVKLFDLYRALKKAKGEDEQIEKLKASNVGRGVSDDEFWGLSEDDVIGTEVKDNSIGGSSKGTSGDQRNKDSDPNHGGKDSSAKT